MTTEQDLEELPFRDIQAMCKERKLVAIGKKAELVKRILAAQGIIDEPNLSHIALETVSVKNDKTTTFMEQKPALNVQLNHTMELAELGKRRMRQERFGVTAPAISMTTSGQNVTESQKLSLRAARFGLSTSDRAF